MRGARRWVGRWLVAALALGVIGVVSCQPQPRHYLPFLQHSYRRNYAIADDELDDLRFYVSRDILVANPDQELTGSDRLIILRTGTRGVVAAASENLLVIRFDEGGVTLPFVTDPGREEDRYWLATEVEGEPGYHKIKDQPEKVYRLEGRACPVVYGADAYLLVDADDLKALIARPGHPEGGTRPPRSRRRY